MKLNISTRALHAFLALQECKHFTHAAERCFMSQSAFSVMIQKLEETVGARLFERDTRNVTLTAEGELFSEVARALVSDIESAFADMTDYVARRKGRVAIAALPSLAAHGLPAVIAEYKQVYPGITVQLFDALSDQCLALLRQGKVDIALTAPGSGLIEFDTKTLCSDPFYLVCREDHPLAGKRRIRVADLSGCELIHLARSTSVRQHVELLLRGVQVMSSGLEVEHLATVAGLIEAGLGVSIVPELTLFQFRKMNLVSIPVDAPDVVRPILIVKNKERSLSIAAQGMSELIEKRLHTIGSRMKKEVA
ncbi:LysR family transcriptional regulator YbhD [Collimonas arenae]|uniref:LysR family transcriptional regulator YbhD n=1 Tax=Collimonas arenae TaxID=279058 RepID=A0A0A1FGU1_9BURK|nr:LysR family transcriptional regulator [Collimonas arenae]AIY42940.1 LysR family transcriptional regulator YbhD [Collimonas arenae]